MKGARGRSLLFSPAVALVSGGLAWLWLLGLCFTWFAIAGQAGNPRPDNWDTLERILDIVQAYLLPALLLVVLTPVVWFAARKFWPVAWLHPALLTLLCTSQALDYAALRADKPPTLAVIPHTPYWPHGSSPLPRTASSPPSLCWPRSESALRTGVAAL